MRKVVHTSQFKLFAETPISRSRGVLYSRIETLYVNDKEMIQDRIFLPLCDKLEAGSESLCMKSSLTSSHHQQLHVNILIRRNEAFHFGGLWAKLTSSQGLGDHLHIRLVGSSSCKGYSAHAHAPGFSAFQADDC